MRSLAGSVNGIIPMKLPCFVPTALAAMGALFQPPAEVHSVQLTEWRTDAGGSGHLYEAVASPAGITWNDAEGYAAAHGGYLVTIGSKEENAFVFKLVDEAAFWLNSPQGQSWGPWLGGTKSPTATTPADGWVWSHSNEPFTYTNWARTEPDNDGGREDRLCFYGEGKSNRETTWNDLDGNTKLHGFVVEYDYNPLPQSLPYIALFGVCVVGAIAVGGMVYFIVQARKKTAGGQPVD
jgi:hypothetical protein